MNKKFLEQYETLMLKQNKNPNKDNTALFDKIERANDIFYEMDQNASLIEQEGNIEMAIDIYENMISYSTDLPHPYYRLAVLYRKQKRIIDEIRVLERAIYVYENVVFVYRGDRNSKLIKFKERLKKAKRLLSTSKNNEQ